MNKINIIITCLFFVVGTSCKSQINDFRKITKKFKEDLRYHDEKYKLPLIYQGKEFNVELANSSLLLEEKEIIFKSPLLGKKFPVSFTVIYKDNLISLFESGNFVCHRISNFTRNNDLEQIINTKKFEYHWIIENKLYGYSEKKMWYLDNLNQWQKAKIDLPFDKKPKLYEDEKYLSYCECRGEWGGTVYFYNKLNGNIFFTEATCANSIIKDSTGYKILSHLGHGRGSTDLKLIKNPRKLTNLKDLNLKDKRTTIGYGDSSNHAKTIFDLYWLQIFSSFELNRKTYYIVHWQENTFLAEINGKNIKVVDPLFNSNLYTHDPITTKYKDETILINLDFYGLGGKREVSMILIKDNEVIKIDWNDKH